MQGCGKCRSLIACLYAAEGSPRDSWRVTRYGIGRYEALGYRAPNYWQKCYRLTFDMCRLLFFFIGSASQLVLPQISLKFYLFL